MVSAGNATMGRPKKVDRPEDVTVRIERDIASMVKTLAGYRGVSAVELLSDLAREPVRKAYAQMVRELGEGKGGKEGRTS